MKQQITNAKATSIYKRLTTVSALLLASCTLPVWAAEKEMAMPADDAMSKPQPAMQGGSAPADARDPHAYSGGYSIESGKYSLLGPRQLVLADEYNFGSVLFSRLEYVNTSGDNSTVYDMQAWYGRDYERLVLKAEGDIVSGKLEEATTELLWGHAIATYWDTQLGVRFDTGEEPSRNWLAFGVQGLAPYWFEVDVTGYVGESGRAALALEFEYEILFSQKLILQPRLEASLYSKDDVERSIGSGLSDASVGFRLRYEFYREFAPYIGIEWTNKYGNTEDIAKAAGQSSRDTRYVAGLRFWF